MAAIEPNHVAEAQQQAELAATISTEAIVVLDVVESTLAANRFGWYAVGRQLMRDLRGLIQRVGERYQLRCMKSTGDGYLLTYGDTGAAELGAVHAVNASFELLDELNARNDNAALPEERHISVRVAIHFGQIDVIENDREGPNVAYAFRLERINRESLQDALNAAPAETLPLRNYVVCSEAVQSILARRGHPASAMRLGLFRFKGFPDWHEADLLDNQDPA